MNLIDKYIVKFLSAIDNFSESIAKLFESKPKKKRKKKKCKDCHCNCHCKDEFHTHHWDNDICNCEECKCTKK